MPATTEMQKNVRLKTQTEKAQEHISKDSIVSILFQIQAKQETIVL